MQLGKGWDDDYAARKPYRKPIDSGIEKPSYHLRFKNPLGRPWKFWWVFPQIRKFKLSSKPDVLLSCVKGTKKMTIGDAISCAF